MIDYAPETLDDKPNCVKEQIRLGISNPLPMYGIHWKSKDGRNLVRVYDSETRASSMQYELILRDPETFGNSWLEKE